MNIKPNLYVKFNCLRDFMCAGVNPHQPVVFRIVRGKIVYLCNLHIDNKVVIFYYFSNSGPIDHTIPLSEEANYVKHDGGIDKFTLETKFEVESGIIGYSPIVDVEFIGLDIEFDRL